MLPRLRLHLNKNGGEQPLFLTMLKQQKNPSRDGFLFLMLVSLALGKGL
jgi:hypothetical protein